MNYPLLVTAQSNYYTHCQTFDEKDGYQVYHGTTITQDRKGLLWIGSDNGLFSFDGAHFKNYRHRVNDISSLPFNSVLFNYQDNQGNYWVGVTNHGLYHFDPKTAAFTPFHYNNQNEFDISEQRIQPPVETKKGALWFPLPNFGLARWDRQQHKIIPYKICPEGSCGEYYNTSWITGLVEDPDDGTLWVGSNDGLIHFSPSTGTFIVYRDGKVGDKLPEVYNHLLFDKQSQLWLGTWGRGLQMFNKKTGQFKEYSWNPAVSGSVNICSGIAQMDEHHLWVGAQDRGFMLFNTATHQFSSVRSTDNPNDSLYVTGMMQNKEGVVWLSFKNKLAHINPEENYFSYYSLEEILKQTPRSHSVYCFARQKQMLYTGIQYDGFFGGYNMNTHQYKRYTLPGNNIYCLSEERNKNIWIGCQKGVFIFDPATEDFLQRVTSSSTSVFFRLPTYCIVHAKDGTKWFATRKGLIHYSPAQKTITAFADNLLGIYKLQQNWILTAFEDSKGNIWFGSYRLGLACYQKSTGRIIYFNQSRNKAYPQENCESITESKDGSILFSIGLTGLCILKNPFSINETITVLNSSNSLSADNIDNIFKDNRDNIWLFTPYGLCWFDPITFQTRTFTQEDGLAETEVSSLPYQDDEGIMYLGFNKSFQVFDPQQLLKSKMCNGTIHLASLRVNGEEWPINPDYITSLNLDHRQTHIFFDFAMLSTQQINGFQYAYKLDGFEKEWNNTGTKTFGQYNGLPTGKYILRIKAANRNGEWNKKEFSLPVIIPPPWYGSRWFYMLLLFALSATIYAVFRYRISQLLKMQQMRTQIASDLHDDIGSTLTSISFLSEMVKMQLKEDDAALKTILDKIGGGARNMVSAMSDIVWVINPINDKTEDLLTRMKRDATEIVGERSICYHFEMDDGLQALKLNMQQRKNIYLIYKEALHNAVKYSSCNNIEISFFHVDGEVNLTITDNGKGFDIASVNGNGNGLTNMKRRATEINGSISIKTVLNEGTCVMLNAKIT